MIHCPPKSEEVRTTDLTVRDDLKAAFGSVKIPWLVMNGTKDTSSIGNGTVESRLACLSRSADRKQVRTRARLGGALRFRRSLTTWGWHPPRRQTQPPQASTSGQGPSRQGCKGAMPFAQQLQRSAARKHSVATMARCPNDLLHGLPIDNRGGEPLTKTPRRDDAGRRCGPCSTAVTSTG